MAERADVVIIGGGVIGTSVAFHLAQLGMRDLLRLERSHLAAGSTGRSVGIVETTYGTDVNVAMAKIGYEELRRFPEVTGETADLHPRRQVGAADDPKHVWYLEKAREIGTRVGLHQRIVGPRGLLEVFPALR